MAQSFETKLAEASSPETLKAAKQLLKSSRLACAYLDQDGLVQSVFQESSIYARTAVRLGSPPQAQCTCKSAPGKDKLCAHAVASIMHVSRFRSNEPPPIADGTARYAGMKEESLESLSERANPKPEAQLFIQAETDFPHVPSKWENVQLSVKMHLGNRDYVGNLNNVRQLYFDKSLALSLKLSHFSLHDRQILHFLAVNAEPEGSRLALNSEATAEFFHSLIDFPRFSRDGRRLIIHRTPGEPALLVKRNGNEMLFSPGIVVNDSPLSIHSAKIIMGRAGCWIGRQGEYWWMPATVDVNWLRNFFRTGVQKRSYQDFQKLLKEGNFPVRHVLVDQFEPQQKKCTALVSGELLPSGALRLKIEYLYDQMICANDRGRLTQTREGFWLRDEKQEQSLSRELKMFGFAEQDAGLQLDDPETIGVFLDQVLPMWLNRRPECCLTANLAKLCRGGGGLPQAEFHCRIEKTLTDRFQISYTLSCGSEILGFQNALKLLRSRRKYFVLPNGTLGAFGQDFSHFLLAAENAIQKLDEKKCTFELPKCSVHYWKHIAKNQPGAIPEELQLLETPGAVPLQVISAPPVAEFCGTLRKYQQEGVDWMDQLLAHSFNAVLADEMGLGKTIQLLALLARRRRVGEQPILIICPASLVENWHRECQKFVPGFHCGILNGCDRNAIREHLNEYDLIIGSYAVIRLEVDTLKNCRFSYLVLDEAQHIKNPSTANAQNCKAIHADHKLVLTGTPLENSTEDLWSIFDFLHPGLLGTFAAFKRFYANASSDPALQQDLAARVAPFIKRRTKAAVCQELPPKVEYTLTCEMDPEQRRNYDALLAQGRKQIESITRLDGKTNCEILTTLLRLRQMCCHPALLPDASGTESSAKFELLKELILQHLDSGNKMLLFSQFTSLLALVRNWLENSGIKYEYLDGTTRNRQAHVDAFNNSPEIKLFLLSLKAGGTGLNLTSADTVIIFDPWWNPAVESQATDRTHRIGQTRSVSSIKLLVKDSIEEKILKLQDRKQEMFDNIIENPASSGDKLSLEEIRYLFA